MFQQATVHLQVCLKLWALRIFCHSTQATCAACGIKLRISDRRARHALECEALVRKGNGHAGAGRHAAVLGAPEQAALTALPVRQVRRYHHRAHAPRLHGRRPRRRAHQRRLPTRHNLRRDSASGACRLACNSLWPSGMTHRCSSCDACRLKCADADPCAAGY